MRKVPCELTTPSILHGLLTLAHVARHKDVAFMRGASESYGVVIGPRKRFNWLIKRGDLILSSQTVPIESETFWVASQRHSHAHQLSLYSCDNEADENGDDDLPEDWQTGQYGTSATRRLQDVADRDQRFVGRAQLPLTSVHMPRAGK